MGFLTAVLNAVHGRNDARNAAQDAATRHSEFEQQNQLQQETLDQERQRVAEQHDYDQAQLDMQKSQAAIAARNNGIDPKTGDPIVPPPPPPALAKYRMDLSDPKHPRVDNEAEADRLTQLSSWYAQHGYTKAADDALARANAYRLTGTATANVGLTNAKTVTEADKIREFNVTLAQKKAALQQTLGERWNALEAQISSRADLAHYNADQRHQIAILAGTNAMNRVRAEAQAALQRVGIEQTGANDRNAATITGANERNAANITGANERNAATIGSAEWKTKVDDYVKQHMQLTDEDFRAATDVYNQQQQDARYGDTRGVPITQQPSFPGYSAQGGFTNPGYGAGGITINNLPPLPTSNYSTPNIPPPPVYTPVNIAPPPVYTPVNPPPANRPSGAGIAPPPGLDSQKLLFVKDALPKLGAVETKNRLMANLGMTSQQADVYIQVAAGNAALPAGGMRQVLAPGGGVGAATAPFSLRR